MPTHSKRITDSIARAIAEPPVGYALHWCPATPGFGIRVTSAGARAWITERRVDGKTVRRTLGKAQGSKPEGRGAISAESARRLQLDVSSELQHGDDRLEAKRERLKAERVDARTLDTAVRDYVMKKRRTKDGLPLKARTRADYLAMVEPAGTSKSGKPTLPGALHPLAGKSLHKITGDDIRRLNVALEPRGMRRRTYALQVLRAVLRHEGVKIEDDPLSPATAGAARVRLPASKGNPSPIPPERLGAWWRAAVALDTVGAAQLRFQLLTGCRPGEVAIVDVADFDAKGSRVTLHDTKNRADHVLILSTQAAEIAREQAKGKKPGARLFGVADAGKSLALINEAADVSAVTAHKLRHTFASVADDLVSAATARAMLNHTDGDVAQKNYIGISEAKLRAGWQAVADFITGAAK